MASTAVTILNFLIIHAMAECELPGPLGAQTTPTGSYATSAADRCDSTNNHCISYPIDYGIYAVGLSIQALVWFRLGPTFDRGERIEL